VVGGRRCEDAIGLGMCGAISFEGWMDNRITAPLSLSLN